MFVRRLKNSELNFADMSPEDATTKKTLFDYRENS